MKRLLLAATMLSCAIPAYAADPAAPSKPHEITVREAIGLSAALRQLDGRPTGKLDKDQNQVIEPYKFDGATLMTIGLDLSHVDQVVVTYQQQKNLLIKQLSNGGVTVPAEKQSEFLEQNDKMLEAPSGVLVRRLKSSDLCLEAKPPCAVANAIPGSVLGQLVPLIDE